MGQKTKNDILIIGLHQSHVGMNAGGYVRLREFLKYIPREINYQVIDLSPSIYSDIVPHDKLTLIKLPSYVNYFISKFFIGGVLIERIWCFICISLIAYNFVKKRNFSLIYVPIGELLHLYLPSILVKFLNPQVKIVVDILNFENINCGFFELTKRFLSLGNNTLYSIALALIHLVTYNITKFTINKVDFVFTVSPKLVKDISSIYNKKTIDYTPSGVNITCDSALQCKTKKYLCIYIGRVTEQKGVYNLLNVWEKVVKIDNQAKLAIAGIIDKETAKNVAEKISLHNLQFNIEVVGKITEKEKCELLGNSSIFLHLANYEPLFPVIGILEAMRFGLPCILFDMESVGQKQKLSLPEGIVFVENGSIVSVVSTIFNIRNNLYKDDIYSAQIKEYSRQYDWAKIAKIEINILMKLIGK